MFVMLISNEGENISINADQVVSIEPTPRYPSIPSSECTKVILTTHAVWVKGSVRDTAMKLNRAIEG
jgi:hypothetical protein